MAQRDTGIIYLLVTFKKAFDKGEKEEIVKYNSK